MTSHDVVAITRRSLNTKKVGHCGTLDPLATGLLIITIGRGTKIQDL
ncbi:tRNA pseudouridine(55) synthase, partial [bacterium]|nr:tRNA pseudouridine(55) synthase [bacterium]